MPAALSRFRARGPDRLGAEPPEHLHDLRHRRAGRAVVHRHGVPGGHDAAGSARRRARSSLDTLLAAGHPDRRRAGRRPYARASSTATSSRPTSSSARAGTSRCSTSASPRCSRRAHTQVDVTTMAGTRAGRRAGHGAPTWRRSRPAARRSITAPTSGASAWCSTKWPRATRPAPGVGVRVAASPELERIIAKCLEPDRDASLSTRGRPADRSRAPETRIRHSAPAAAISARRARTRWRLVAAAALAVGGRSSAGYVFAPRAATLTDKDTIVLAEFTNTTGDPVFDDTLRQGLAAQLQQSPFLSLVSDERIRRTLPLMNQPADARLTADVARVVCVRTGGAAVLQGSIAALGSQYVLGLRATNCATGRHPRRRAGTGVAERRCAERRSVRWRPGSERGWANRSPPSSGTRRRSR